MCDYELEKRKKNSSCHLFMIQAIKMIQQHCTFWTRGITAWREVWDTLWDTGEEHLRMAQDLSWGAWGGTTVEKWRDKGI